MSSAVCAAYGHHPFKIVQLIRSKNKNRRQFASFEMKWSSSRAQPGKFPGGFGAASRPPGACSASKEKRRRKGREDAQIARAFARFAREEEVTSEQDAVRSGAWRARSRSRDGAAQQPPQTLDKEVCLRSLTLQGGHFGGRCVARPPCQSAWRSVREHAASDVGSEMRHHVLQGGRLPMHALHSVL